MVKRGKYLLLLLAAIALIIIGASYAAASGQEFRDQPITNAPFMGLVPEKCRVIEKSEGVDAAVEFKRDRSGSIIDRAFISLVAENVYAGANISYRIVVKNISSIPLSLGNCALEVESGSDSLEELISFSGSVKIYNEDKRRYDLVGSFEDTGINQLADKLTGIMKYRKIDISDEVVIELNQKLGSSREADLWGSELSYALMPAFVQYFPEDNG